MHAVWSPQRARACARSRGLERHGDRDQVARLDARRRAQQAGAEHVGALQDRLPRVPVDRNLPAAWGGVRVLDYILVYMHRQHVSNQAGCRGWGGGLAGRGAMTSRQPYPSAG